MEKINNSFFDSSYKEIWRLLIPKGLTEAEVKFLEQAGELKKQDAILDMMCGYGRHAIPLARLGYEVTAVDNSKEYIAEIEETQKSENLSLNAFHHDILTFPLTKKYKLATCMGNSISFFNRENCIELFRKIASHLTDDGKFIFNSWMVMEILLKNYKEKTWEYVQQYRYLIDLKYDFQNSRLFSDHIITSPEGNTEVIKGVDYIFTFSQLKEMLSTAGLEMEEIYASPTLRKYKFGDGQCYIMCRKAN